METLLTIKVDIYVDNNARQDSDLGLLSVEAEEKYQNAFSEYANRRYFIVETEDAVLSADDDYNPLNVDITYKATFTLDVDISSHDIHRGYKHITYADIYDFDVSEVTSEESDETAQMMRAVLHHLADKTGRAGTDDIIATLAIDQYI